MNYMDYIKIKYLFWREEKSMDNIEKQKNVDDATLSYKDNVSNANINTNQASQNNQNNIKVEEKNPVVEEKEMDKSESDLVNLSALVDEPSKEIDDGKKEEKDREEEEKRKEAREYALKKENLIKQLEIKQGIKREDIVDISLLKQEEKEKIKALYPYQLIDDDKDLFVVETRDKDGNPVVGVYTEDGNVVQEQLEINKEGEIASKKEIKKMQKEKDKEAKKKEALEEEEDLNSLEEDEQQELAENEIESSEFGKDIDTNSIRLFRKDNPLYKSNPELRTHYNGIAVARKNDGQYIALIRDLKGNWQKMGETNGKKPVSQQITIDDRYGNSQDFTGKSLYMMQVNINGGPNTLGSYFAFQQEGNKSEYNVSYLRQFTDGTYNGSVMQLQGRYKVDRENNEQIENRDNTSVNTTDRKLEQDYKDKEGNISELNANIIDDNGNKTLIEKQNRFIAQYFPKIAETDYNKARQCASHMVDLTEGRNAVPESVAYDMVMKEIAENNQEKEIPEEEQKTLFDGHDGEHRRGPLDNQ